MKISEILSERGVIGTLAGTSKDAILGELATAVCAERAEIQHDVLLKVLLERERLGSTAIGEGIAIPHGKLPGLKCVVAAFGRAPAGVDFDSVDGQPTTIFFLLVAPEDGSGAHLKALARVSRLLRNEDFRTRLLETDAAADLFEVIRAEDEKY